MFTYAEGLFARLAHDLRLTVTETDLVAERSVAGEGTISGTVALARLRVDGVMKGDRLRDDVLSAKDCDEILEKMRLDVFGGAAPSASLSVRGALDGARFTLTVEAPNGRASTATGRVTGSSLENGETIRGEVELSLRDFSGRDVKGPLGAFRIADRVRVTFDATFVLVP